MKSVFGIIIISFLGLTYAGIGKFQDGCRYKKRVYREGYILESSCFTLECKNKIWNFKGINEDECNVCHMEDDPLFKSFDGGLYYFHGICNYTLSQEIICDGRNSHEPKFAVHSDFVLCDNFFASCVDSTSIRINPNTVVTINHKTIEININGNTFSPLPSTPSAVSDTYGNFYPAIVWSSGDCAYVLSDIYSIKACRYDLFLYARIEYRGELVGLCGHYSGYPENDFLPRKESREFCDKPTILPSFAISWMTKVQNEDCLEDSEADMYHELTRMEELCFKHIYYDTCREKVIAGHKLCEEHFITNNREIERAIDNCVINCCIKKDKVEEWTENAFKMAKIACEANLKEKGIIIKPK